MHRKNKRFYTKKTFLVNFILFKINNLVLLNDILFNIILFFIQMHPLGYLKFIKNAKDHVHKKLLGHPIECRYCCEELPGCTMFLFIFRFLSGH